jgi:hypothetical protein
MQESVTLAVRVKPGARRDYVGGSYPGPYGPAVVVSVRARAVDGNATEAARRALAAAIGVHPNAVDLRAGHTCKNKLFTVKPAPADLEERIRSLRTADQAHT